MTDLRPRILAIDDAPENLLTLGAVLATDFNLQIATSGEMGLALARKSPPDLILLDVMMPGMDGFETCRLLKVDSQLTSVPVIFVTALTETTAETVGLSLGAADFITKPINVEIARHRIKNLIEREQLRKTVEAHSLALERELTERKKAEETRRVSEERYRALVETASEGILVAQGTTLRFVNPLVMKLTGYSEEELISLPFMEFVHPDDRELMRVNYLKRLKGEALDQRYPIRILTKAAGVKWVEMSGARIDWEGQPATLNFVTDITERKQLEEANKASHEQLAAVFDSLDAIVYVADMETHELLFVNKFVKDVFGDIAGQPCWKSIQTGQSGPCAFCTNDKLLDAAGNPAETYRWEFQNTVNRHWYDIHDRAIPWVDGRIVRLEIATDITERKQFESELKHSNAELEQFSYAISHDMRQPLRMISSYMQLLAKSLADQLDGEKREYLNYAIDGAKRMDTMMLGLLEYSRVGRKGEPPVSTESHALLDEALLFLQPAIAEAQAVVHIQGDWPRVFVSPDEMLRLLQNLIGNALKFRVAGRIPEIVVASESTDNQWRLSVADNGVGIQPDQISRLFQVFQRLQSRADYEGTGIGLAICRKIAEHHHGRIWAESKGEGQGSVFHLELPLAFLASGPIVSPLPAGTA